MAATFDLKKAVRPNILSLHPYRCARDDYSEGVLLDANENRIGPSTVKYSNLDLNRYPDPLHYDLKEKIGALRQVSKEQIFLGVGSNEAIDILFRIFCKPSSEENVVITPPTYEMYTVWASINDVVVKSVPLTSSFDVDMSATLNAIDSHTKMIILCSPGNPTARVIPNFVVEQILSSFKHGVVVIDEAYIDFAKTESAISLIKKYLNVVVLQTLSKAFGLAGIRIGMAFGREELISLMNSVKAPYNINKLSHDAALSAFDDLSLYRKNVHTLLIERDFLLGRLKQLAVVKKVYPSEANFILFEIPKAELVHKTMADRGIVCRYRGKETHCEDCLRVSVGTHAENEAFLALLSVVAAELGVT